MKECKISIILPVYNTSKYLDKCMESLLKQTLEEIEIIAVNDGSTDNSLEILKKYQTENTEKLYVYNTENHGVSHARNYGIEKAAGKYIWFVDSDDYVEYDACERLYNKAEADNNDLVLFSRYDIDEETGKKSENKTFHFNQNFKACDKTYEMVKLSPFPWNKFIRRDLLNGVSFPEGIRFEDLPVAFILFTRAENIGVINDYLYDYRAQVGFLSKFTEATLDIVKAMEFLRSTLENDGTLDLYKNELEYIAIRHFFYRFEQFLVLYFDKDCNLKKKLVNTLFDYLDEKYPDRENNPYLLYNLPDRIYRLYDFYSSKEALLEYIEITENMTFEEQIAYNSELVEKYSPSEKCVQAFDAIKEKEAEKSLLFNTEQNAGEVKNSSIFISDSKNGISSSLLALLIYVSKSLPEIETAVFCSKQYIKNAGNILNRYGLKNTRIFERGGNDYVKFSSRAKYIFSDCPLEHYFKTADGQTYINLMTEHIAAKEIYKQPGNDYCFPAVQKCLINADFTLYLNESSKNAFEENYKVNNLSVKSLCGINPSTDLIGKNNIRKCLGIDDKKVLMLAPKYKAGDARTPVKAFRKYMSSLIQLDKEMKDDEIAVLCLDEFPFKADISIFSHIILLPDEYSLFDFAASADIIATNYHQLIISAENISAQIVRYITDEKRYIEDEQLEISNKTFPVISNTVELAKYLHKSDKSEIKRSYSTACQKLFDAINNKEAVSANDTEEATVLYFLGGKLSENRIRTFKRIERNNPVKKYYLAFDEGKNPDYKDELLELIKSRNYIPIRFDSTGCFDKKTISAICSKGRAPLFGKDKLDGDRKKEWKKYFGDIHFDEIMLISVGEIERNLMFIGAAPQMSYNFSWFSIEKYNNKKAFKCKVDYICKELKNAQRVVIPEEMQGIKSVKNLKIAESFEV